MVRNPLNIKTYTLDNMSAGINTKSEENALISYVPQGANDFQIIVKAEARDVENMIPLNRGGQTKTYGYSLFKDTLVSKRITGLHRFIQKDGTNLFIFSQGTTVNKFVSGTITDLGTTITDDALVDFETANDTLIVCDGTREPLLFDGSTFSTMGGTPPPQARQSIWTQDRAFIFGKTTDPSLLFHSDAGDIEAGYASNFIQCDVDDGQKITAIGAFFIPGNLTAIILVGKERSIGIIDGDGTATNPYTFKKIAFDFGVPGFRQLVQFAQDMAYFTELGINSYQAAQTDVNLKRNILTSKVTDQFKDLSSTKRDEAIGWYDTFRERICYAVTEAGFTHPNVIWNLDLVNGGWYKVRPTDRITAILVDTDGIVYQGNESGKIFNWDEDIDAFNTGTIASNYKTPFMDFGKPNVFKRITQANLTLRGEGSYSIGVTVNQDFGVTKAKTETIDLSAGSFTWKGGQWTSDSSTYQWGASPIFDSEFYPGGWFKTIQFEFTQSGANQPFDLFEFEMDVQFAEKR